MSKLVAERCDGARLRRAFTDAAAWVEDQADEINALNVFPVPDGDTGTNMAMTLQAAVREAAAVTDVSSAAIARAVAQGALLGARGNSGVILSQFLRGIARSLEKHPDHLDFGPTELAQALVLGSATAHKAVIKPVEGTMLTVGRDAAQAALASAESGAGLVVVLEAAVVAARASVARTPSLLPILRQAGVVDAGGQGLLCLLEGILRSFEGKTAEQGTSGAPIARPTSSFGAGFGYCTEFLLRGESLDLEAIRQSIVGFGDSALVVGETGLARVHVHTFRPGQVLEYASRLGSLHSIKIDNMQEQHEHVLLRKAESEALVTGEAASQLPVVVPNARAGQPGIVAVASGVGFAEIFRSLGVTKIVPGGQTMNPSTEELLRAVQEVAAEEVLLLPNNGNILLAAKQVQLLTRKRFAVVPTRDMAQGVAAAMAFQPEADLAANAKAMERGFRAVRTGEVTTAVRAAKIDGFAIRMGETVGLVGDEIVAAGETVNDVIGVMLERMAAETGEVLTVYYGATVDTREAQALADLAKERYANLTTEVMSGGQPLYQYVLCVE